MSKNSFSLISTPPEVDAALARLGESLALARLRRKESQRIWSQRLGISVPTLIRLERGDSSVSMGIYATALWMMGRVQALGELADPVTDLGALEMDIRNAKNTRASRSKVSSIATLAKKKPESSNG